MDFGCVLNLNLFELFWKAAVHLDCKAILINLSFTIYFDCYFTILLLIKLHLLYLRCLWVGFLQACTNYSLHLPCFAVWLGPRNNLVMILLDQVQLRGQELFIHGSVLSCEILSNHRIHSFRIQPCHPTLHLTLWLNWKRHADGLRRRRRRVANCSPSRGNRN